MCTLSQKSYKTDIRDLLQTNRILRAAAYVKTFTIRPKVVMSFAGFTDDAVPGGIIRSRE